jgi:lipopolysaccharide biosynthesis glycosyltransferase
VAQSQPIRHLRQVERAIAITGGDANYFDLMRDCIDSLQATPEGRAMSLGILDCGLTDEQRAWCRACGATLVVPQWDFEFPGREKLKDGYKALTARPFLPRYFPGFDLYLWIDGDCWVQQGDVVALFLAAARTGRLAVAPEIHRSMRHYRHAWTEFSTINGAAYESAFGKEIADRLIRYPLINAGVFAIAADAPHWQGWAELLGEALQRSTDMTDQIALNVLAYDKGFACEPLPSRCNWPVHHATPAWDADRALFVEPAMPYEPLGILHLTIYTKRLATMDVREVGGAHAGQVRARSLRWPGRTAI